MSVTESHLELVKKYKEDIPERYEEAFWELTGSGMKPSALRAAIMYIENEVSQYEAAEEYDVTDVAVRDNLEKLIDTDYVTLEEVRANSVRTGKGVFGNHTVGNRTWKPEGDA